MSRQTIVFFLFFCCHAWGLHAQSQGSVGVHSDPRLDVVIKKDKAIAKKNKERDGKAKTVKPLVPGKGKAPILAESTGSFSGQGFRVQIYNGTDRYKASKIREEFDRNYPGVPSYISYVSPYYRVKVGNYRKRSDAMGMFREASSSYFPCMIVPDKVTIK